MPYTAPRTSLNGPLTPHRRFAAARVDLERVKALRRAYDVKLNDIVLALCAGALRGYLEARDELPVTPLVAQCPVSLRGDDEHDNVGNKVGSLFASLATDIADPAQRVQAIHQSTMSAKEMQRALSVNRIMGLTETTPPGLVGLAARAYSFGGLGQAAPPPVNLVISNVPGPTMPLYLAGARLEAMYPMGPLLFDMGLNITVLSYCGSIDFGFIACPELIAEPSDIASRINDALDELEAAAGIDLIDVREPDVREPDVREPVPGS
jgi:WS/DGAT/MGAT family acyltransferase